MEIFHADKNDIPLIMDVAEATWKQTYSPFIDPEQVDYMYERMYTAESLAAQMESGVHFLLCRESENVLGFIAYEFRLDTNGIPLVFVPKLYVKPEVQRRQIGKKLLEEVSRIGESQGCECIELNVNRNNPALYFYEKLGFTVLRLIDIPFGPFLLNDYVLRKRLPFVSP